MHILRSSKLVRRKVGELDMAPVIRALVVSVVAAISALAVGLGTGWLLGALAPIIRRFRRR